MTTKNATIPSSLASIIPVDMLQTELTRRLMNMTISDLLKIAGTQSPAKPKAKPTKKSVKKSVKKVVKKSVKKVVKQKRRRTLTPIGDRIAAFLQGATSEWQSLSEIAAAAGVDVPGGDVRRAMLNGYTRNGIDFPAMLEWNGLPTQAARYRTNSFAVETMS